MRETIQQLRFMVAGGLVLMLMLVGWWIENDASFVTGLLYAVVALVASAPPREN